jgi:IS5 family transposase
VCWRQRVGEAGCEWLLAHSIEAAKKAGVVKRASFDTVVLDTTVQPKSKLYALHAPEVECLAKGKARTPYESGEKVSVALRPRRGSCWACA